MKNIVRAFVIVLTLSGSASFAKLTVATHAKPTIAQVSAMPIPTCEPGDPDACGMGKKR